MFFPKRKKQTQFRVVDGVHTPGIQRVRFAAPKRKISVKSWRLQRPSLGGRGAFINLDLGRRSMAVLISLLIRTLRFAGSIFRREKFQHLEKIFSWQNWHRIVFGLRSVTLAKPSVVLNGAMALVLIVVMIVSSSFPGRAATYTVGWTTQADFETNQSSTGGVTTRTNVDTTSVPGDVKLSTYTKSFTESFTNTTYKDAANTNADWNTAQGQLKVPPGGGVTATDLTGKLTELYGGSETVSANIAVGDIVYLGLSNGKFLKYDSSIDITTDLTSRISSFWGARNFTGGFVWDSVNEALYMGGENSVFAKYIPATDTAVNVATKTSAVTAPNAITAITYDSDNAEIYFAAGGLFGKYSPASDTATSLSSKVYPLRAYQMISSMKYAGGRVYVFGGSNTVYYDIATDTADSLNDKIIELYGTNENYRAVASAGNVTYFGTYSGRFFSYDATAGAVTNLTSVLGTGMSNGLYSMAYDPVNQLIYIGGSPALLKYSIATGTAQNITSAISTVWGSYGVATRLVYNPIDNSIFVVGAGPSQQNYLAKYDPVSNTAVSWRDKISSIFVWQNISGIGFDATANVLYLGGQQSKFAKYDIGADVATDLSGKLSSLSIYGDNFSFSADAASGTVYGGTSGGYFFKYVLGTDAVTNLTAATLPITNWSSISSIAYDSVTNAVYVGCAAGPISSMIFLKYDVASGNATNLNSGSLVGISTDSMVIDPAGQNVYGVGDRGSFFKYSVAGNAITNLAGLAYKFLQGPTFVASAYDSVNQALYFGNGSSQFIKYDLVSGVATEKNSLMQSSIGWATVGNLSYDPDSQTIFIASNTSHYFAKYSPGSNSFVDLKNHLVPFWFLENINSISYSNGKVYLSGVYGNFGVYNIGSNNAVDLGGKISAYLTWVGTILSMVRDTANDVIYIGLDQKHFARYTVATGIMEDLTGVFPSQVPSYFVWNAMAFDSNAGAIYLGTSSSGSTAVWRYNIATNTADNLESKFSPVLNFQISSLAYDPNEKVLYVGGLYARQFVRYNTPTYTSGGTYPTADTVYNLQNKLSGFLSDSFAPSLMAFDATKNVLYMAMNGTVSTGNEVVRYNTTSYSAGGIYPGVDTGYSLSPITVAPMSGAGWSIYSLLFDEANQVLYFGTYQARFLRYNTDFYVGGGAYPTANTAYNLTGKLTGINLYNIYSLALDSASNSIFIGGYYGAFAKYSATADAAVDLTTGFNFGTGDIKAIIYDPIDGKPYVAGVNRIKSGVFGGAVLAQSTNVDLVITDGIGWATLTANDTPGAGTITYFLSNNGGSTWFPATKGAQVNFSTAGSALRFKITLTDNATVQDLTLSYGGYYASGSIKNLKINAGESAVWGSLTWNANPNGQTIKLQTRAAATEGDLASATWSSFLLTSPGSITSAENQWLEINLVLESLGSSTPVLHDFSATYIINARPQVQNVVSSQNADGTVAISYETRDPDSLAGSFTPGFIIPSFQYSTNNGSTWTNISAGLPADATTQKAVDQVSWNSYATTWNAKAQADGVYSATTKIRVTVNDSEPRMNTASADSAAFAMDVKGPAANKITIDRSSASNQITIGATDDNTDNTKYALDFPNAAIDGSSDGCDFAAEIADAGHVNWKDFTYPSTQVSFADNNDAVRKACVLFKDKFGNLSIDPNNFAIAPANPESFQYYDVSNTAINDYRLFLSWGVPDLTAEGRESGFNGFAQYEVRRCRDLKENSSCTPSGANYITIASKLENYFTDTCADDSCGAPPAGAGMDPAYRYCYNFRIKDQNPDPTNDYSKWSSTLCAVPGAGTSSLSKNVSIHYYPTADENVPEDKIYTTQATIRWQTVNASDPAEALLSDSTVWWREQGSTEWTESYTVASYVSDHAITIPGRLSPGTTYEYRVTSTTPWGTSDTSQGSNPATFTTKIGPVIENVQVTDYGNTSATVTWDTRTARSPDGSPSNASSAIFYSPAISATGSLVAPQGGTCTGGFTASHSCVMNGLNPGTPYYFYVYSVLETDPDAFSADTNGGNYYSFTTTTDHSAPVITPGSNPRIVTDTQAAISWGTDEKAKSWILYDTVTHDPYTFPALNFNPLIPAHNPYAQSSGNSNSNFSHNFVMNVNTLSPNTTYYYRMVSQDTSGNVRVTAEYSFTTLPVQINHPNLTNPGDPTSGNLLMKTDTSALIKITTNTHSTAKLCYATTQISDGDFATCLTGDSGDNFHMIDDVGASTIHAFVLGDDLTAENPALTPNTQYFYRIQVTDSENAGLSFTSADSAAVNFTTLPDPSQQHDPLASISTPDAGDITVGDKFAFVSWDTDQPANQELACSPDTGGPYTLTTSDLTSLNKSHTLKLSNLTPDTPYFCQVSSTDDLATPTTLTSGEFSFTTAKDAAFQHDPLSEITNISNPPTVLTDTKAVISFDTDQAALCLIQSGTASGNYTNEVAKEDGYDAKLKYNMHHVININGLIFSTKYYYKISCEDNLGTAIEAAEGDFTTTLQQAEHPALINPGNPYDVLVSDMDAVIQLPMLNTEATSKLCFSTEEITDVDNCPNYKEITTPSRLHSYYLDMNDLDPDTLYYIRTKVTDSLNTSRSFISSSGVTFLTWGTLVEHPDLTTPGVPAVVQYSDTEAAITIPTTNTTATSRICYSAVSNIDIDNCPSSNLLEITAPTRVHFYHLSNLLPKTLYYFKTKVYDAELPDNINFVSSEVSFTTLEKQFTESGLGDLMDKTAPVISNINVSSATGESVTITWNTDEKTSSSVKYGIVAGTFDNMAGNSLESSATAEYVTAHTVVINNLIPSTKYYYTVISVDTGGNIGESSEANFTTASPSSLSSIKAVSNSLNEATITWKTSKPTSSTVEYGLTENYGEIKTANQLTQEHSAVISNLDSGQTYHFRVKGKDEDNNLFSSGDYTFVPKSPPQILSTKVTSINEHGATIEAITNIPTDILVSYTDLNDANSSGSQGKPELVTNHSIEIKNLPSGDKFSVQIKVRDQDGNETTQEGQQFTTGKDETAPKIDQVRTDSALAQNDKVQSIISWNTDEPSTTALVYQEGRSGEKREVIVNSNLTLNHVAVITTFKPGIVYYFKAKSVDQSENIGESTEYALLTPKTKQNIIQVIIMEFQGIFGWANMAG